MPRSFDMSVDYEGTADQVYRAFCSKEYWLARLVASGADESHLDAMTVDGDGVVTATTTQVLGRARLPGIATQFLSGDMALVRTETWRPIVDGRADATVTGGIKGAPLTIDGTGGLRPALAPKRGSRLDLHATVEVRIPLVGGKIEGFVGSQLTQLLVAEQQFTTAWIDEHGATAG